MWPESKFMWSVQTESKIRKECLQFSAVFVPLLFIRMLKSFVALKIQFCIRKQLEEPNRFAIVIVLSRNCHSLHHTTLLITLYVL